MCKCKMGENEQKKSFAEKWKFVLRIFLKKIYSETIILITVFDQNLYKLPKTHCISFIQVWLLQYYIWNIFL